MIGFLSSALISPRMEQNLKNESIESQPTLLLHFHSHTDKRYKDSLLKTMLHRAYALSSTREAFDEECAKLRSIFSRLDYPWSLTDSVISNFVSRKPSVGTTEGNVDESNIIRINLPSKDQVSANSVRRQLCDLNNMIGLPLHLVFVSKKLEQNLEKPNRQLFISDALFIILYVICVMQIMSAIEPDTFFNVSLNTKIRQLAIILMKRMAGGIF